MLCCLINYYKFPFSTLLPLLSSHLKRQHFKPSSCPWNLLVTSRNPFSAFQNVYSSNADSSHPCDQGSTTAQADFIPALNFLSHSSVVFHSFPPHLTLGSCLFFFLITFIYNHSSMCMKQRQSPLSIPILNFPVSGLPPATSDCINASVSTTLSDSIPFVNDKKYEGKTKFHLLLSASSFQH